MKKELLITSISILLNQPSTKFEDVQYFENKKHDDSVNELKDFLIKNMEFIGNPQFEFLQGLNDHGVDLLLKSHNDIKIGFQIKSHIDITKSDFANKVKSQIAESAFHDIDKLYILICSPYKSGKDDYSGKISHLLSELSGYKTNYHCAYSPISCIGLFIKNVKIDVEYFHSTLKKYIVERIDKEKLIKEIAPEEQKPRFLSRFRNENSNSFKTAKSFLDFIREQGFEIDLNEFVEEIKAYCNHIKKIPKNSRDFFVSVLTFAEPYGQLGNCINCVKAPYMDIIDSIGIDDNEMFLRIKNLERHKLLSFDEDDPYEDGQMVIGIVGSKIDYDLNLSFEIREFFENDLNKLKEFYIDLDFKGLD